MARNEIKINLEHLDAYPDILSPKKDKNLVEFDDLRKIGTLPITHSQLLEEFLREKIKKGQKIFLPNTPYKFSYKDPNTKKTTTYDIILPKRIEYTYVKVPGTRRKKPRFYVLGKKIAGTAIENIAAKLTFQKEGGMKLTEYKDDKADKYVLKTLTDKTEYKLAKMTEMAPKKLITQAKGFFGLSKEHHMIMKRFKGESLSDYLIENTLSIDKRFQITKNLLLALDDLHQRGIIHRDIKPGNIIINTDTLEVKIIDVGLSRKISQKDDLRAMGTVPYVSPEQFLRESEEHFVNKKTDYYSMGMVLAEVWGADFSQAFPPTRDKEQEERNQDKLKARLRIGKIPKFNIELENFSQNQAIEDILKKEMITVNKDKRVAPFGLMQKFEKIRLEYQREVEFKDDPLVKKHLQYAILKPRSHEMEQTFYEISSNNETYRSAHKAAIYLNYELRQFKPRSLTEYKERLVKGLSEASFASMEGMNEFIKTLGINVYKGIAQGVSNISDLEIAESAPAKSFSSSKNIQARMIDATNNIVNSFQSRVNELHSLRARVLDDLLILNMQQTEKNTVDKKGFKQAISSTREDFQELLDKVDSAIYKHNHCSFRLDSIDELNRHYDKKMQKLEKNLNMAESSVISSNFTKCMTIRNQLMLDKNPKKAKLITLKNAVRHTVGNYVRDSIVKTGKPASAQRLPEIQKLIQILEDKNQNYTDPLALAFAIQDWAKKVKLKTYFNTTFFSSSRLANDVNKIIQSTIQQAEQEENKMRREQEHPH